MTDIVERLRAHKEARLSVASGLHEHDTPPVCRDAADEITRLRAELAKRDGEVLALREALTARVWHDADLTEKMRRYIVPSVDPNSIEADEFIAATIEHLDGPHQRKNDKAARHALRSSDETAKAIEARIRADALE